MSYNNKVVLVTGASSGIGAAVAIQFATQEAKVVMVGRNADKLKIVEEKCKQNGTKPLVIIADITNDTDVKKIINDTVKHFGKLDVLINNAGVTKFDSILSENAVEVFDKIMATNLRSIVHLTNLAAPELLKTKGNIVNMSSVVALGVISSNNFAYSTSKAALDHFTRCVALELAAYGVRVNTVNPGPVRTDILENAGTGIDIIWDDLVDMTALKRISEPDEVADLVLFLASDKAKSVTGSSFVTDNGTLLKGLFEKKI